MRNTKTSSEKVLDRQFRWAMAELKAAWAAKDRDTVLLRTGDIQQMMDDPEEFLHVQLQTERNYPSLDHKSLKDLSAAYEEVCQAL